MTGIRKKHSKGLKFQGAIAMIKGEKTIAELSSEFKVHQSVLNRWKQELLSKGPDIFEVKGKKDPSAPNAEAMQKKIGQLTMEIDFLKKVSGRLM
jgi:transposase-like protein